MDRRWAVAVGLGVESMKPKPDASSTIGFTTFELAGRFRIRPAIEVALALNGAGAFSGNFASGGLGADFRYRFMAEESVNFYVLGGIGVQAAAAKNAPEVETKGRALFRIGGGAELRYNPIALSADLRLYGIAENPDVPDAVPSTTRYEIARYSVSGIQLVFGATYYF